MVIIPLLKEWNLVHCTICASVSEGTEIPETLNLRIGKAEDLQFILVAHHPHGTFLHVEMALSPWFDEPPPRNGTKRAFDLVAEQNRGKTCDIRISGTFRIPVASLPENGFVTARATPTTSGSSSVHLVGAEFKITGTPFQRLQWAFVEDGGVNGAVDITLRGRTKSVISNSYLQDAVEFLSRGFSTIVTGSKND